MKCKIHNNANYQGLDILAKELYEFAHKRFGFSKPVTIVFESNMDNSGKVFAPTGNYDPQAKRVTIFVDQRHPKDILRSLAHELVHHKQNCDGHFDGGASTGPGYAQRDQHMREMEGDAYRTGNVMLFRDWEDNYKKGSTIMNENKEIIEEAEESCEKLIKDRNMLTQWFEDNVQLINMKPDHKDYEKTSAQISKAFMSVFAINDKGQELGCEWAEEGALEENKEWSAKQKEIFGSKEEKEEDECEGEDCPEKEEPEETVEEEQKTSDKQWYQSQLHEALLKKFKIIK